MDTPTPRKKPRLTNACELCRKRKVRCDDRQPDCTNCIRAGVPCRTTDPRHPHRAAERQRAGDDSAAACVPTPNTPSKSGLPENDTDGGPAEERLPALPRFQAGHAFYILTQWLDIALSRLGLSGPLCWLGESYNGTSQQCLTNMMQSASAQSTADCLGAPVAEHSAAVYELFPLPCLVPGQAFACSRVGNESILHMSVTLLIRPCVADTAKDPQQVLQMTKEAVTFTLQHLGWITIIPSPLTVQALLLLSLQLRACDHADVAWHIITLALSIAQTMCLHRRSKSSAADVSDTFGMTPDELERIWWCLYTLERTLSVELERPSNINDKECDLDFPYTLSQDDQLQKRPLFCAAVHLAHIQGQVIEGLLQNRAAEEGRTTTMESAICDKIRAIGHLDAILRKWVDSVPDGLRPANYMDCNPALLPCVAHLALQFYATEFLLHRHALILNNASIQAMVARHFPHDSFRHRLMNAHNICSRSTRTIVAILGHLHDNHAGCLLLTLHPASLAAYGLALQIISRPHAVTVKSDAEVQDTVIAIISRHNDHMRDPGVQVESELASRATVLQNLRETVKANIDYGQRENKRKSGMWPCHHDQSLSQRLLDNDTARNRQLGDQNAAEAFEPPLDWSSSFFATEDDFDWEAFANAFNLA